MAASYGVFLFSIHHAAALSSSSSLASLTLAFAFNVARLCLPAGVFAGSAELADWRFPFRFPIIWTD